MKGTDLLKWGFLGWLAYNILKESSQPSTDVNYNKPNIQIPDVPQTLAEYNALYPAKQPSQPTGNSLTDLDISKIFEEAFNTTLGKPPLPEPQPPSVKPILNLQIVEAGNWLRLIPHPSIVLILGKRGGGKSALGYRLLEHLR
jgi:hypothetical protein